MIFVSTHIRKNEKRLSNEEINALALPAKHGDTKALDSIVRAISPIIIAFLTKKGIPKDWNTDGDDIYQECMGKCIEGVRRFDPGKGASLLTYLFSLIFQGYIDGFYQGTPNIRLPKHMQKEIIDSGNFWDVYGKKESAFNCDSMDDSANEDGLSITDICYFENSEFSESCDAQSACAILEKKQTQEALMKEFNKLKPLQKQVAMLEAGVIDYCKSGLEYMEVFHGMAGRGNTTWHKSQARKEFEKKGMREWLV